ncbi:MAG: aminoacyl-tRNA hydrolase [Candidatus Daviesbacteria bacterium]|nr:MAG: aminoacyl-tRNA hydrolase [Candidatus Daviesbacteria bacterium]
MKLIIGLGNPGEKYIGTRHNLGFVVVDALIKKLDVGGEKRNIEVGSWKLEEKFKSEIIKTPNVILAKPQTYMNNSGLAVKLLTDYFKIPPEDIIVVHDELDLPLGKIKVRKGGAAAGHHGVQSIIAALNFDQFVRVRLGIGNLKTLSAERKGAHVNTDKFVLEPFISNERAKIKHLIKQAVLALETLLEKGLDKAQSQFN